MKPVANGNGYCYYKQTKRESLAFESEMYSTSIRYKDFTMYVCICHDVKDAQIKTALAQGVNGMDGLQETLSVGTCCGCCIPMVQDLVDEHQANFVAIDVMAG